MDFSAWDWATQFRLHEAACLIAGVMPVSKKKPTSADLPPQARPILLKLMGAHWEWYLQAVKPERPKAIALRGVLNPDGTLPEFPVLNELADEIVSRTAIREFISEIGRKSAYDFSPIEKKKLFEPVEAGAEEVIARQLRLEQADTQPQAGNGAPVVQVPVKPLQRTTAQDTAILTVIQQAGHDPLALPKNESGKRGVKFAIRQALNGSPLFPKNSTVFNKAWERLRLLGDIADKA